MKKWGKLALLMGLFWVLSGGVRAGTPEKGARLFRRHCNFCHPGGRNVVRKGKELYREVLIRNGITSPEDIVKKMRHPGPGMPTFSERRIPDDEARAIAEYVWKTFRKD
ncbi:c-type cytochrome [Thermosulfurimonas sp. F29]|uniref:c-type cytochrome n=1 Tax=Thermosulfurimonas sp. F29 TaxID=2867247 RepID=UPI001C83C3A7|nr:c-type cytochrome [Thermosulfurimonas sp. F29]MBX6423277.1 c-type cytochrome [Thermosulfurimonas sp. F29]